MVGSNSSMHLSEVCLPDTLATICDGELYLARQSCSERLLLSRRDLEISQRSITSGGKVVKWGTQAQRANSRQHFEPSDLIILLTSLLTSPLSLAHPTAPILTLCCTNVLLQLLTATKSRCPVALAADVRSQGDPETLGPA